MSIHKDIIDWIESKPLFWQVAIDRLIKNNELTDEDIIDLKEICKVDYGLSEFEVDEVDFDKLRDFANNITNSENIILSKIYNVDNINALSKTGELEFAPEGLTIVYGDNGSGKSSYVSILKHACNTRGHKPKINDNLYDPSCFGNDKKADIEYTIDGIISNVKLIPNSVATVAAICIIMAAIIQSAMYPFQRWLLSAMTSPTPASALMHAGFVNGAGILLTIFSTIFFETETLTLLFVIGGITALIAQFTKLMQVNVKQKLACSTIAQMGFMIMQCGLGFFNAAVAHLILHGFYKAYLVLSAGEEIKKTNPTKADEIKITPIQALIVLIFGSLGAFLFSYLTGKNIGTDSGLLLTLIVAITVGQVTYNIVKQNIFTSVQKIVYPIVLFTVGIGIYALIYNGVTFLMKDMPMVDLALPISAIHILFGTVFLLGFFIMKLGVYRRFPWLYVKLMNDSQPYKKSILHSNKK